MSLRARGGESHVTLGPKNALEMDSIATILWRNAKGFDAFSPSIETYALSSLYVGKEPVKLRDATLSVQIRSRIIYKMHDQLVSLVQDGQRRVSGVMPRGVRASLGHPVATPQDLRADATRAMADLSAVSQAPTSSEAVDPLLVPSSPADVLGACSRTHPERAGGGLVGRRLLVDLLSRGTRCVPSSTVPHGVLAACSPMAVTGTTADPGTDQAGGLDVQGVQATETEMAPDMDMDMGGPVDGEAQPGPDANQAPDPSHASASVSDDSDDELEALFRTVLRQDSPQQQVQSAGTRGLSGPVATPRKRRATRASQAAGASGNSMVHPGMTKSLPPTLLAEWSHPIAVSPNGLASDLLRDTHRMVSRDPTGGMDLRHSVYAGCNSRARATGVGSRPRSTPGGPGSGGATPAVACSVLRGLAQRSGDSAFARIGYVGGAGGWVCEWAGLGLATNTSQGVGQLSEAKAHPLGQVLLGATSHCQGLGAFGDPDPASDPLAMDTVGMDTLDRQGRDAVAVEVEGLDDIDLGQLGGGSHPSAAIPTGGQAPESALDLGHVISCAGRERARLTLPQLTDVYTAVRGVRDVPKGGVTVDGYRISAAECLMATLLAQER
ncbi:hypothetical protein KIPB_006633 [Kipferlia bialata]|uniref:Uncharacterized protein n=1 Tax=Kipferlia bialata TaxID=797122 RepID=A0A9K3CZ51_9EUKA|nr:hypothetical protein KIPB_006633 [Kipferlia bialata]|eukprot:g6633.t1